MIKLKWPRVHLFEFHELSKFPNFLKYQTTFILYIFWTFELPEYINKWLPFLKNWIIPRYQVVSEPLSDALITLTKLYAFEELIVMDMCSGGSGPNTLISKQVNLLMKERGKKPIKFHLSDLFPNIEVWKRMCSANPYLSYIDSPIDITKPFNLPKVDRVFQTFYCCFHHFDDDQVKKILKNSLSNSDGFAIIETTSRTVWNVFKVGVINTIFTLVIVPFYIHKIPISMLITLYIVPILLFTFVWDNIISALRTRSSEELLAIIKEVNPDDDSWEFSIGSGYPTYPTDKINWLIGIKNPI